MKLRHLLTIIPFIGVIYIMFESTACYEKNKNKYSDWKTYTFGDGWLLYALSMFVAVFSFTLFLYLLK